MSTHADEPPMLSPPQGQLREWVQLALLLADMIARRRERMGREAWSEERDAERALDRAGRDRNVAPATDEQRARHLVAGRWEVAGRSADRPQARITTAISRVDDRWVLHAIGHRGPPAGDAEAWLSCPTREVADRVATALLSRDDPERIERLRDELQAAREQGAGYSRRDSPGERFQSSTNDATRTGRAQGTDRFDSRNGAASPGEARDDEQDDEQQRAAAAAVSAMETELRAVFDRASADAVCADPRWPSVVREMLDAQAEGHDVGAMLQAARTRLRQPLSNRSYYRSPAAYLFALFRKERDRANAGDYIDMPEAPSAPRAADADPKAERGTDDHDAGNDQADEPARGSGSSGSRAGRGAPGTSTATRNAEPPPEVVAGVLAWVEGLDSEDDMDRILAEDTVGKWGREVDQALGEKFPGLLSPHRPRRSPTVSRSDAEPRVVDADEPAAGPVVIDAPQNQAPENADPVDQRADDSRVDAHRAAAEHAAALEADGHDEAAVARASVSVTPTQAASDAASARRHNHDGESPSSPSRTAAPGRGARSSPSSRTPNAPGQRPPRR